MLFIVPLIIVASLTHTYGVFVEENNAYLDQPPVQYTYEWNVKERFNFWEFNFTMSSSEFVNVTCELPRNVSYALIAVHSYVYTIKLLSGEAIEYTGSDIGVLLTPVSGEISFALINPNNVAVRILGLITPLQEDDPLPGGSVSSAEVKPFMEVQVNQNIVKLRTTGVKTEQTLNNHSYEMRYAIFYMYSQEKDYSAETYFDAIRQMTNMSGLVKEGQKDLIVVDGMIEILFANYPGTGVYYNLMIEGLHGKSSYVVAHTFGCENVPGDISCQFKGRTFTRVLYVIVCVCGLLLCGNGFMWQSFEVAIQTFLLTSLLVFTILSIFLPAEECIPACVGISAVASLLATYYFMENNIKWLHHFVAYANFCLLVSSVILFFINLIFSAVVSPIMYWVGFAGCSFITAVLCMIHVTTAHYLTSSVIGSFLIVSSLDYFAGSSLKFIVFDNVRRIVDTNFKYAIISPPFQTPDYVVMTLWLTLFLISLAVQCFGWEMLLKSKCFDPPLRPVCLRSRSNSNEVICSNSSALDYGSVTSYHEQETTNETNDPNLSSQVKSKTLLNLSCTGSLRRSNSHIKLQIQATVSNSKYYECTGSSDSYPESVCDAYDDDSAPLTNSDWDDGCN